MVKMTHWCNLKLLLFLIFISNVCFAVEKYWMPNLEWGTAGNWMGNRLPEIDSHVIFPLETRHVVGVARSANLRLAEIDLARFGSLLLARDGKLEIVQRGSSTKISKWKRKGHLFWADPENWNGTTDAAPHFERVPCRQDDIVLPEVNRTFSVLMPITEVQVRSARLSNELYPFIKWEWENLKHRREFDRRFTVKYSEYTCEKCKCQEDNRGDYLEEICAIQRPRCDFPACEYPLRVEGHCCQYCGGRVLVSGESSLAQVRMLTSEALEGYEKKVSWHLRRRWDGVAIEVLFKEKGTYSGIDIVEAVERARSALLGAGVELLSTETAGAAMQDSRLAVALGPLFGAPLIVLLVLLLGFLYFGYSLRHILSGCREMFTSVQNGVRVKNPQPAKPFGFARFENASEGTIRIADVEYTSPASETQPEEEGGTSSSGGRFENPLYRSKRRKTEEKEILHMDEPLSLSALNERVSDPIEEVELSIDQ